MHVTKNETQYMSEHGTGTPRSSFGPRVAVSGRILKNHKNCGYAKQMANMANMFSSWKKKKYKNRKKKFKGKRN